MFGNLSATAWNLDNLDPSLPLYLDFFKFRRFKSEVQHPDLKS
jgi:hypothetical protein